MDDSDSNEDAAVRYDRMSKSELDEHFDNFTGNILCFADSTKMFDTILAQIEATTSDDIYKVPSEDEIASLKRFRDENMLVIKIANDHVQMISALRDRKTVNDWIDPVEMKKREDRRYSAEDVFVTVVMTLAVVACICLFVVTGLEDTCIIKPLSRMYCVRKHAMHCHFDDFDVDLFCNPRPLSQNLFFVDLLSRVWAWLAAVSRLIFL